MTDPDAQQDAHGHAHADTWVPLAEIARPHGVKGEVRLKLFNKTSDMLLEQEEVLVRLLDGTEHEVSIERARRADDAILMKLHSIDNRDRADEVRGALICVRRRDFPPPEEGEFYTVDIVGAEVRLVSAEGAELPKRIGEIIEIISYPTVEAMLVRADDEEGDWEIPLTDTYIAKLDTQARVVDVLTLDELDRAPSESKRKAKKKEKKERRDQQRAERIAAADAKKRARAASGLAASTTTTTPADARSSSDASSSDESAPSSASSSSSSSPPPPPSSNR